MKKANKRSGVPLRPKITPVTSTHPPAAMVAADFRKRVFLVDDHPLMRRSLAMLVNEQPDMYVCGQAENTPLALQALARESVDILVADLSLPGRDGMDLLQEVACRHPKLPVLVLSMHDELCFAERALHAGARGYIMKSEPLDKVLAAIEAVLRGEISVSAQVTARMMQRQVGRGGLRVVTSVMEALSNRELQVFEGIGSGLSTQQIAGKYGISAKTVETYRAHIKDKLGLACNNKLIHAAVRWQQSEATGGSSVKT